MQPLATHRNHARLTTFEGPCARPQLLAACYRLQCRTSPPDEPADVNEKLREGGVYSTLPRENSLVVWFTLRGGFM